MTHERALMDDRAAADTIADGAEVRFEDWAPLPGADDAGVVLADVEIATQ